MQCPKVEGWIPDVPGTFREEGRLARGDKTTGPEVGRRSEGQGWTFYAAVARSWRLPEAASPNSTALNPDRSPAWARLPDRALAGFLERQSDVFQPERVRGRRSP